MKHFPGIYLRGTTYWLARQRGGKRKFYSLDTDDLAEAIKRAKFLLDLPENKAGGKLAEAVARFLIYKEEMGVYTKSSVQSKSTLLRVFSGAFPDRSVSEVSSEDVQKFYTSCRKKVSDSTANGYLMTLRSFFRWVIEVEKIRKDNPAAAVNPAKTSAKARQKFCSKDVRDKLISECDREDLRFVLFCGFHAGMRFQEIVEARRDWFDLPAKLIHLRKHAGIQFKDREERTIPMTTAFAAFLAKYGEQEPKEEPWEKEENPYMLKPKRKKKKSLYRYDFGRPFGLYVAAQGVPWVTPHVMRHTFASLLASSGVSIYKIAQWLGDDVRVVQKHYAKLSPGDLDIERAFT